MSRPRRVGLPWYALENYPALRTSLDDGEKLPPLYDTWRIATEQMEREVQRSGVEVVRVPIEPNAFAAWCSRNGGQSDGAARARYAAEMLAQDAAA
ncbi:hypothetical protein [Methylobacterium longum]|uniref:Uncharacterized protein n=1 Tax=Methylobacterium longum TaxID=767694 RepID=A0ABT8AIB3_9HYPH|nr:hypothetical protein [Methylobacterium longum]MDN3569248.1 hypothetical protein [Methylobacterium longum]GJE14249.1 hypothetical protein FOHLNKBM_5322 [Methylobacterium longum]